MHAFRRSNESIILRIFIARSPSRTFTEGLNSSWIGVLCDLDFPLPLLSKYFNPYFLHILSICSSKSSAMTGSFVPMI
jgi:hypothetical protein